MSPPGPDRQKVWPSTKVTVLSACDSDGGGSGPRRADRTGTPDVSTCGPGTDQRP